MDCQLLEVAAARVAESVKTLMNTGVSSEDGSHINENASTALRNKLIAATVELQQLVLGANEYVELNQIYYQQLASLRWLLRLGVFSKVPLTEAIPYITLASSLDVPLSHLERISRMAMTGGLFTEPKPGYIAHSRISAQFATRPAMIDWTRFTTEYIARSSAHLVDASIHCGGTEESSVTAYNIAFDTPKSFFQSAAESDDMADMFAGIMRTSSTFDEGLDPKHVLAGLDWLSLGSAHVVDVGGSSGHVSAVLATHHPRLHFTVQDLPVTLKAAEEYLSTLDPSIASRVSWMAHDFFVAQPAEVSRSADVYFLRRVLHDWSFDKARAILQHLAAALKPGAVIAVMETILPQPGSVSCYEEGKFRARDLGMLALYNGQERDLGSWQDLCRSTTPRLQIRDIYNPSDSTIATITLVRDGSVV